MFLKEGVLPPSAGEATPIPPTPAWRVKSGLIRRFGEETAMGTYLKYARHRSFSPKPPSERQFDAPRQKLASLVSEVLEKGRCPFRRLALPILAYPRRAVAPPLSRHFSRPVEGLHPSSSRTWGVWVVVMYRVIFDFRVEKFAGFRFAEKNLYNAERFVNLFFKLSPL